MVVVSWVGGGKQSYVGCIGRVRGKGGAVPVGSVGKLNPT